MKNDHFYLFSVRLTIGCLIFIYLLPGCINRERNSPNPCLSTVEKLTDRRQQWIFLDSIGKRDQQVRNDETAALQQYGYDSKEHKQAKAEMMRTDASNLDCIEAYLAMHGHPSLEKHGMDASQVPGMVIHHSPYGMESRLRNFEYLYRGYLDHDVYESDLIMILNRAYQIKFGERIVWDRPYRSEEELDTLIRSLDLTGVVERIRTGLTGPQ